MNVSKCPKCGSHDIMNILTWDIVVGQCCGDCDWEKRYGYVAGQPGNHYFQPYTIDSDFDFYDDDDDSEKTSSDCSDTYYDEDYEESDDLPF